MFTTYWNYLGEPMMMSRQMLAKRVIVIGSVVLAMSLSAFAAQGDGLGYALLIQQSPPDAGTVTLGIGVHKIGIGQSVQLTAAPRPGYRFLYWLGDVSATTSAEALVSLDSPKMVIAVFERESFDEDLVGGGPVAGASGRGGGLRSTPNPLTGSFTINPSLPFDDDFPVPRDKNGGSIPVPGDQTGNENPIPEPATIVLLGAGVIALLRTRK